MRYSSGSLSRDLGSPCRSGERSHETHRRRSRDDDRRAVEEFRTRLGLTFPILLDPQKQAADAYQSYRFPESYLIRREGVLVTRYIRPRDWDAPAYVARIRRLLEMPTVD